MASRKEKFSYRLLPGLCALELAAAELSRTRWEAVSYIESADVTNILAHALMQTEDRGSPSDEKQGCTSIACPVSSKPFASVFFLIYVACR